MEEHNLRYRTYDDGLTSLCPTIVPSEYVIDKCLGLMAAAHQAGYGKHPQTNREVWVCSLEECHDTERDADEQDAPYYIRLLKWHLPMARGHILPIRLNQEQSLVLFIHTQTRSVHIEDPKGLDHVTLCDHCQAMLNEVMPSTGAEEWTYSYSATYSTGYPADDPLYVLWDIMSLLAGETLTMGPDTERLHQWLMYKIWMQGEVAISWGLMELTPDDFRVTPTRTLKRLFQFIQWTATKAQHIAEEEIDLLVIGTDPLSGLIKVKGGKSMMYATNTTGLKVLFNPARFHQPIHKWVIRTKLTLRAEKGHDDRKACIRGQDRDTVAGWTFSQAYPEAYCFMVNQNIGPVG
eukprot:3835165-Rhodomonas_salina.2